MLEEPVVRRDKALGQRDCSFPRWILLHSRQSGGEVSQLGHTQTKLSWLLVVL